MWMVILSFIILNLNQNRNNQHYVIYSYIENTLFNHFQIDSQELLDIIGEFKSQDGMFLQLTDLIVHSK